MLRYSGIGTYYDGTSYGNAGVPFDIAVTNRTRYRPWDSSQTGLSESGAFAQINLGAGSTTRFAFNFYKPGTNTPVTLANVNFNFCFFDFDTGINGRLQEKMQACNVLKVSTQGTSGSLGGVGVTGAGA